jgi:hypothetical protein
MALVLGRQQVPLALQQMLRMPILPPGRNHASEHWAYFWKGESYNVRLAFLLLEQHLERLSTDSLMARSIANVKSQHRFNCYLSVRG